MATLAVEEVAPIDVWVVAILLKEELQSYAVTRFLTRKLTRLSVSSLFVSAIQGNGVALLPVFKSLIQ